MKAATFDQAFHIMKLIKEKEAPREQIQAIIDSGLLSDLLDANIGDIKREDFRKACGLTQNATFIGEIDYADSWDKRLKETGIDPKNISKYITPENFPVTGTGVKKVRYELVSLKRPAMSEEYIAEFAKRGLKRPGIEHGLDFTKRYPDEQRRAPIVILCAPGVGDVGSHVVPVLDVDGHERWLDVSCVDDEWDVSYLCLGVRED